MPTHDDKQKAGRLLDRAVELHRSSAAAVVVAGGLLIPSYFGVISGWVGASVIGMSIIVYGVAELHIRAARRIMNRQHRRQP